MEKIKRIGRYIIRGDIGKGSIGKVKLGENEKSGEKVAIKIIKKSSYEYNIKLNRKIKKEISLMRMVSHPNIIKLIEIIENKTYMFFVIQYAQNGDLFEAIVQNKGLNSELSAHYLRQLVSGMEYLHSLGICHRDIKPENLLLDCNNNLKIADFSFAKFATKGMTKASCGSLHYVAPEVISGSPYNPFLTDIWSCGVVLYTMISGQLPFDGDSYQEIAYKINTGDYSLSNVPILASDLICRMLCLEPSQRISFSEIQQHPFFLMGLPKDYSLPVPLSYENTHKKMLSEDEKAIFALLTSNIEHATECLSDSSSPLARILAYMRPTESFPYSTEQALRCLQSNFWEYKSSFIRSHSIEARSTKTIYKIQQSLKDSYTLYHPDLFTFFISKENAFQACLYLDNSQKDTCELDIHQLVGERADFYQLCQQLEDLSTIE